VPVNPVEACIRKKGTDPSTVFVFPSDIAASLWLETALDITGEETLPSRRFIAWDRFKEDAVQASVSGKSPVSSVLRKLYALSLAERNKNATTPFFAMLIPPEHAESGSVFASWIARALPQLGLWERKLEKTRGKNADAESADLAFLKADYTKFLEANELFEPSWQRPPLKDTGKRYIIFFPEAIEDYDEYASLLGASPFIEAINVPIPDANEPPVLCLFENTRAELSSVALSIETLLREGVSSADIAVSVPDLETIEPYLLREFSLRGIPYEFRAGNPLGSLPAGRLFALAGECVSTGFSFSSMKAILLDRLIPWIHRDLAGELVSFGIRNHCVASWKENGKDIDVWEEAFKAPTKGETGDWRLRDWYRSLSKYLRQMTGAKTFTEVRNGYFAFREKFLDMQQLSEEDDAVLARCVEELNALASLEGKYSQYTPQNPFAFFTSVLDEKKYVPQRARGGVSVFPYRVAAGTPFPHHFVIDASQNQATVLYSQLPFLRQDKRVALNLDDKDASAAFFSMYAYCGYSRYSPEPESASGTAITPALQGTLPFEAPLASRSTHFSFAELSFSGYRIPHGYFLWAEKSAIPQSNPFAIEREFLSCGTHNNDTPKVFPDRLYPVQKNGFSAWQDANVERGFSYLESAYGARLPVLAQRIKTKQMNGTDVRVSQSDLKTFATCNAKWFLSRVLALNAETSDAELLDERNLGLLYHDVLKRLYEFIRETDGAFNAAHLNDYRERARILAGTATADHAEFRGPIAAPLIEALSRRVTDGICGILERDAEILDGFIPEFLEDDISFSRDGIVYYGMIDRISRRPSDNLAVLIDYKSGKVPSPSVYATDENTPITDYQIPMYVFLAEESPESPYHGSKIEFAWFAGIQEGDYRPVLNDNAMIVHGKKRGMILREEFDPAMASFRDEARYFAEAVQNMDFKRPEKLAWAECQICDFRKICRFTYAVRP